MKDDLVDEIVELTQRVEALTVKVKRIQSRCGLDGRPDDVCEVVNLITKLNEKTVSLMDALAPGLFNNMDRFLKTLNEEEDK